MNKVLVVPLFAGFIILLDIYVFQLLKVLTVNFSPATRKILIGSYWLLTVLTIVGLVVYNFLADEFPNRGLRNFIMMWIFIHVVSKIFALLFVIADDVVRLVKWTGQQLSSTFNKEKSGLPGQPIPRSEFLAMSAFYAAAIPATIMGAGVLAGAYNYQVRRNTIYLPNLPGAFDGIRIGQLSDIHSGSFFNRSGAKEGIELFMAEKPDIIFFTGDLVNHEAREMNKFVNVFDKLKAPLGVYSVLGNHDYGEYRRWSSAEEKQENVRKLISIQKEMGWDLLVNENRTLKVDGENIAVIGVENWGMGGFQKYGDLAKAHHGTQDVPVKLLLSHDPSHWDAQVRPKFPDIDVTFSGHTHGLQFGVELGDFKWSPSQYIYEQWAGLYEKNGQYVYVNRGFGFIGYPGRIGIWPELTIVELRKA
jgi:uncharacterized protein